MNKEQYEKISILLADNDDPEVCFEGETMPNELGLAEHFKERAFDILYDLYQDQQKENEK